MPVSLTRMQGQAQEPWNWTPAPFPSGRQVLRGGQTWPRLPPPGAGKSFQMSPARPLPLHPCPAPGVRKTSPDQPRAVRPCHLGPPGRRSGPAASLSYGLTSAQGHRQPRWERTRDLGLGGGFSPRREPPERPVLVPGSAGPGGVLSSDAGGGAHSPAPGQLELRLCSPGPRSAAPRPRGPRRHARPPGGSTEATPGLRLR